MPPQKKLLYRKVAYVGHMCNMVRNFVDPQKNYEKNFFFNSLLYYGRLKSPLSIPQSKKILPLKLREILLIRTTLYKITPKFHFRLLYQGKIFFLFRLAIHIYVIKVGIYHISFLFFSYKKFFYLNETKFWLSRTIMTKRFFFKLVLK